MSESVTFELNGKELTVPKGTTVIQAAKQADVEIPHFCWHPGLSVAGVCRFCMVKVEGRPKLEIGCNLQAIDGMKVQTATDDVKEAHKWALEFHLINHPLDCPICDQAGECGLQDYYMDVGKYESQMERPKVLKPKAVDVGSELILDTERCILCSRCVRFEDEVTKTGSLGIFDRGDRAIIGTYGDDKIDHNYQENLVDICPVGAFTSKRFRFKQRVWFLKEQKATCPGCSTGCSISVHAKPEVRRYFRVKPELDPEVNGHWICDRSRTMVDHLNPENRLSFGMWQVDGRTEQGTSQEAISDLKEKWEKTAADEIAVLVSAQLTCEEYDALFKLLKSKGVKNVFQWRDALEKRDDFDGILLRGDYNANTSGLQKALKANGFDDKIERQVESFIKANAKLAIVVGPEVTEGFSSYSEDLEALSVMPWVSFWTTDFSASEGNRFANMIPLTGFAEKRGHFINFNGLERKLENPFLTAATEAIGVEVVAESVGTGTTAKL